MNVHSVVVSISGLRLGCHDGKETEEELAMEIRNMRVLTESERGYLHNTNVYQPGSRAPQSHGRVHSRNGSN